MKAIYRKTFRRNVKNGVIIYAGMPYTSAELQKIEGKKVEVTKFVTELGSFDISRLLINTIPYCEGSLFWIE